MRLRTPLIMVSGFSPVQTSLTVRRIRSLGLLPSDQLERGGMRWPWEKEHHRDRPLNPDPNPDPNPGPNPSPYPGPNPNQDAAGFAAYQV